MKKPSITSQIQGLHWIESRQTIQGYIHEDSCFTIYKQSEDWGEESEPINYTLSLNNALSSVFHNFDSCVFNSQIEAQDFAESLIDRFLQILEKPFRRLIGNKYIYYLDEMQIANIELTVMAEAESCYNTANLPTVRQSHRYDLSLDSFFYSFFPNYNTATFLDLAEAEAELDRLRQVFIGRFV